jgi:anthranilate phosphoribosyltransferase
VATVFNFLGPLSNPAQPEAAAIGVSDARMAPVVAGVCARRGTRAVVFRGEDGLDELTTTAPSRVWVVAGGEVAESVVDPVSLDLPVASLRDLRGGDAAFNAAVARSLLAGERGPVRDAVLLNAAAALVAYDGELLPTVTAGDPAGEQDGDELADQLTTVLRAGMERAARAIDSGAAADVLDRWLQVARDSLS